MNIIPKARELLRRITSNENPLAVLKTASDISVHGGMAGSTPLRRAFIAFMRDGFPWLVLPHVRAKVNGRYYYMATETRQGADDVAAHLRTLPQA